MAIAENDLPNRVTVFTAGGVTGEKPLYFFLERYKEAYIAELASFVDAVLHQTPPKVSGEDGLENMYAALAAGKSLKEKRPVFIDEVRAE
ncbi:putative Myo-inositol 2-dehydrogenase [Hollandina sp. SP2]